MASDLSIFGYFLLGTCTVTTGGMAKLGGWRTGVLRVRRPSCFAMPPVVTVGRRANHTQISEIEP